MIIKHTFKLLTILSLSLGLYAPSSQAAELKYDSNIKITVLEREIKRIADRNPGNVGVSFRHLETGIGASLNAETLYFMASTYKIPMAVRLLQLVDQGKLSLDDLITVREDEYVSWSLLAERFNRGPVAVSLSNLMELMLVLSDNTATDVLLRAVGGAKAVTDMLRRQGLKDMVVARGTKDLIIDFANYQPLTKLIRENGLSFALAWEKMTPVQLQEMEEIANQRGADPSSVDFLYDNPKDKASPKAMLKLLEKIWTGNILSQNSRDLLLTVMARCETGASRIKGKLPNGTIVMHKTGTLDTFHGVTNNAGVISLPDGKGNVAIVVFIKNGKNKVEDNEEIIADISQAVYNYFLYTIAHKGVTR